MYITKCFLLCSVLQDSRASSASEPFDCLSYRWAMILIFYSSQCFCMIWKEEDPAESTSYCVIALAGHQKNFLF